MLTLGALDGSPWCRYIVDTHSGGCAHARLVVALPGVLQVPLAGVAVQRILGLNGGQDVLTVVVGDAALVLVGIIDLEPPELVALDCL